MKKIIITCAVALGLAGCGASSSNPPGPTNPSNIAQNVLQLAVGTANLYGVGTGLNVVVTYRQPKNGYAPGDSGALISSPSLVVAGKLPDTAGTGAPYDPTSTILTDPSLAERGTKTMTSTSQAVGSSNLTTFGLSGGAFSLGLEPFNYLGGADGGNNSGTPFQVAPYPVPLYVDASGVADPYVFVPWGGPPAFNLPGADGQSVVNNGNYPAGTAGVSEGLDVFEVTPKQGGYALNLTVATSSGSTKQSAHAQLKDASRVLGTAVPAAFTADGSGGGSLAITMPTGATEAFVQVTDFGPTPTATTQPAACNGATAGVPIYYTVYATGSGTQKLPDSAGPGGTPSVCSAAANTATNKGVATPGDSITIQTIGFDYPIYQLSPENSGGNPSPTILGSHGQDDLTISPAETYVAPDRAGPAIRSTLPVRRAQTRSGIGLHL